MKAMKSKILKWVSVAMVSAMVLGAVAIPAKTASAATNESCTHSNQVLNMGETYYPHATISGHKVAVGNKHTCLDCHAVWYTEPEYFDWEAHTVVGTHCIKCGYNMEASAR